MLLAGVALSLPASLIAAWAPSIHVLVAARVLGGVAAGLRQRLHWHRLV